ncbi:unnamed protein product, partial [Dovyalis caffra]
SFPIGQNILHESLIPTALDLASKKKLRVLHEKLKYVKTMIKEEEVVLSRFRQDT